MSTLGSAIKEELRTNAATAALLAAPAPVVVRVFPLVMPQKVPRGPAQYPAVVYNITTPARQVKYCGTDGLVRALVDLDSYDTSYDDAHVLADAVRAALLDFRGALGGIVAVKHAALENEIDLQDPEPGLFRVNQTWAIWYAE